MDADNNVDVSVYQGEVKQKSCGTLHLTYGLKQSDQIYTMICNDRGDTVKLSKTTGTMAVFEVEVTSSGNFSFVRTFAGPTFCDPSNFLQQTQFQHLTANSKNQH